MAYAHSSPDVATRRRPIDANSDDPTIPRVVTIEDRGGGLFERVVMFPDGSSQCEFFGCEDPPDPTPGASGADAAARRLVEAAAGTLLHDPAAGAWFAFDGILWRREPHVTRRVRAALREAGVDDPWPALVATVEQLARSEPELAADPRWDPRHALGSRSLAPRHTHRHNRPRHRHPPPRRPRRPHHPRHLGHAGRDGGLPAVAALPSRGPWVRPPAATPR